MPKSPFSQEYRAFRRLLVAERRRSGLSQEEVTRRLDRLGFTVTQSVVSKVERGERRLDIVEFVLFARAIGFDPSDLVREFEKSVPHMD